MACFQRNVSHKIMFHKSMKKINNTSEGVRRGGGRRETKCTYNPTIAQPLTDLPQRRAGQYGGIGLYDRRPRTQHAYPELIHARSRIVETGVDGSCWPTRKLDKRNASSRTPSLQPSSKDGVSPWCHASFRSQLSRPRLLPSYLRPRIATRL